MLQPSDLQRLGVQLSQDFLEKGAPMDIGLRKIASQHSLNIDQLHRVAETANTRTHLEILKTASYKPYNGIDDAPDTYVRFPLADASKVGAKANSALQKEASSHYSLPPERD